MEAVRRLLAPLRRIPRIAWGCALLALVNCVAWTLIVPPFQVPDEPTHVAYAQYLAESGELPHLGDQPRSVFSPELLGTQSAADFSIFTQLPEQRPRWDVVPAALEGIDAQGLPRQGSGDVEGATSYPPLYYVAAGTAYKVTTAFPLVDRVFAMRLVSALLAALTALFVVLFLRELLPRSPYAWAVGGIVAAVQPLFGFISAGVNNDALFFTCGAALLYALARALRRGLTVRTGIPIGVALAAGLLTKLNMVGLAPAVLVALAVLVRRARAEGRRGEAVRAASITVAVALVPFALYAALSYGIWDRTVFSDIAATASGPGVDFTAGREPIADRLTWLWQWYLPDLWFMDDKFGDLPFYTTFVQGFVGRFGWLEYGYGESTAAWWSAIALAVLVLAATALVRARAALRGRLGEFAVYVTLVVGLLAMLGWFGYTQWVGTAGINPGLQARYLLPLLPLYAALVALAVRGAGRRAGPAVGAALVVLALAHGLFAQAMTVERYFS